MKVGFLSNQLDNRGTGNAMFDYAKYNQDILGNESVIFTFPGGDHSRTQQQRYYEEFKGVIALNPNQVDQIDNVDVMYHIKFGTDDGIRTAPGVRYAVHSVFTNTPHGDRYATISSWLARGTETPYVPHIIELPEATDDFRDMARIPKDAIVFGRYGALDTFNVPFVWEVIDKVLEENDNVYFFFANTPQVSKHPHVRYWSELVHQISKTVFINSCDYMLHARTRGETFGISVGEFASLGKPIITYSDVGEQAHLDILGSSAYTYKDQFDLYRILSDFALWPADHIYGYTQFTAKLTMKKFEEVFLS